MFDEEMTTAALLEQWREATRAAELAERLAKLASESAQRSDRSAEAAEEIARLAQRAARAAQRAAGEATRTASLASEFARENRNRTLAEAERDVTDSVSQEAAAKERYHQAELRARERPDS